MTNPINPRNTIAISSGAILLGSLVLVLVGNTNFGVALLLSGALTIANFKLAETRVKKMVKAVEEQGQGAALLSGALSLIRLLCTLGLLWLLLERFDPIPILVGLSSIPGVIFLQALIAWINQSHDEATVEP